MIELGCAGCSSSQQDYISSKSDQYNQYQQQQLTSSSQTNPLLLASTTSTTPTPYNFHTKFGYFQQNHLQSASLAPLLLASSNSQGANGQFVLSADARACVTATYLCVLIVNNAWLDCNLLEMLCNNSSAGQSESRAPRNSHSHSDGSDDSYSEYSPEETYIHLNALESALDELIAFAGGGTADAEDGGGGVASRARSETNYMTPARTETNESPLRVVELHDKGGGGFVVRPQGNHDDLLAQMLLYGQSLDKEDLDRLIKPTEQPELSVKMGRVSDEDRYRILEQYFSFRRNPLRKSKPSADFEVLQNSSFRPPSEQDAFIQPTTQQPVTSPSSIVSWVGRPFRGWSSYSFWSSPNPEPAKPDDLQQQQQQQQLQEPKVQILRPIDRSEQYNDIATNQSSQKPILNQYRPNYQQEAEKSSLQTSESSSVFTTHNSNQLKSNNNSKQPVALFAISQTSATPTTFSDLVSSGAEQTSNIQQQTFARPASTTPTSLMGAYEFPNMQGELHHHRHQQQQQHQFQEEQSNECKCNELSPEDAGLMSLECRFRCSSSGAPASPSLEQVASSFTTSTTSSTISPSGGKMNPLDVTFLLYTRYHRDSITDLVQLTGSSSNTLAGELIDLTNETTLNESRLNISLPIKIVIHGFGSGGRRPWVIDMVYKLLDYEDVNVIVVDWEKGAALPNYVQAAGNTRLVGHKIACLIKSINAKYGLTGNSYHLIGFSLGAHVAGFAGMEIRNSTSVSRSWINRITGLDPASPLFEGYEASDRLDPSDAQFVDVIHSNGDGVLRGGFGSLQPMGHVDFYPNGGRVQVGCNSVLLSALSDIIYGKWQSLCNHRRALNFFMDSFEFSKCRFRSFNCDSYENYLKGECFDCGFNNEKCSYMGYLANYSKGRGKMYLTTHEEAPFCANQFLIKIVGTKGFKTHWGKVEVTLVTLDGKNESFWLSSVSQQSTNHESLNGGQKDQSQHSMQSLIVAHPMLVNFTQILLRYTKYKGWIYSGDESWSVDKVFITDSDGQVKSYCGFNTVLESHITTRLNLEPGNCTITEQVPIVSTQSSSTSGQRTNGAQNQPANQQQQQQSARSPRLFSSIIPPSDTQPLIPHGHAFQRMAPTSDRQQQFSSNFNNIPFVAF